MLTFFSLIYFNPLYRFELPLLEPKGTPVKLEGQNVHSKRERGKDREKLSSGRWAWKKRKKKGKKKI